MKNYITSHSPETYPRSSFPWSWALWQQRTQLCITVQEAQSGYFSVTQDINLYAGVLQTSRGHSGTAGALSSQRAQHQPNVRRRLKHDVSSCSSGSHLARLSQTPPCTRILEISPAWDILHVWIPGHVLPMQFLLAVNHNSSPPSLVVFQIEAYFLQGGALVLSSCCQHL
jgi:hypothetical protein